MKKKRAIANSVELEPQPRKRKATARKAAKRTGAYFTEDGILVIPPKLAASLFPNGVPSKVPIAADGVVITAPRPIGPPPAPNLPGLCFQLTLQRFSFPVEVSNPNPTRLNER